MDVLDDAKERIVKLNSKDVPVEVAGYRDANVFEIDDPKGRWGFRTRSVKRIMMNDDHLESDFEPWEGDSDVPPF